jgi:hypothetical protein
MSSMSRGIREAGIVAALSIAVIVVSAIATPGSKAPAQVQTAVTEDGKKVILKSDGTWLYAESDRKENKEKRKTDEYAGSGETIEQECKKDWPEDFAMRNFCEKKQRTAVEKLKAGKPLDISERDYVVVHTTCSTDWPKDFSMRHYCEQKQFDALRELRKR